MHILQFRDFDSSGQCGVDVSRKESAKLFIADYFKTFQCKLWNTAFTVQFPRVEDLDANQNKAFKIT